MSNVAIVALPRVDDKVYKISSEKVPHMTLCFLGDSDSISSDALVTITQFVEHAASELSPFGMTVDYRDVLGPEQADVVFFENPGWDGKRIRDFRAHLLKNDTIKTAWDSAPQFPAWIPHLTLGYPTAPAHEDTAEYPGIHYVSFDRIAVWIDDSDGPTFRLKLDDSGERALAWSEEDSLEDIAGAILKHYGKKGMKWGVRNDKGHEGERVKTRKLDNLDKKWEKENAGFRGAVKAHNAMADRINNDFLPKHNNDPRWKDIDFTKPEDAALLKTYEDEFFAMSDKIFREETVKFGMNPSGTKAYEMRVDEDGNEYAFLAPVNKDAKHAEDDTEGAFKISRNAKRFITKIQWVEVAFKHYGVKGMRWGVTTKDRAAQRTPTPVVVTQKKSGKFAKTSGGKNQPITDEAKAALILRQKAKASTTDSLTNQELQTAVRRMQLEKQYAELSFSSDRRSRGVRFVAGLLNAKKPTKFKDMDEEVGKQTREGIKQAVESLRPAKEKE